MIDIKNIFLYNRESNFRKGKKKARERIGKQDWEVEKF